MNKNLLLVLSIFIFATNKNIHSSDAPKIVELTINLPGREQQTISVTRYGKSLRAKRHVPDYTHEGEKITAVISSQYELGQGSIDVNLTNEKCFFGCEERLITFSGKPLLLMRVYPFIGEGAVTFNALKLAIEAGNLPKDGSLKD